MPLNIGTGIGTSIEELAKLIGRRVDDRHRVLTFMQDVQSR